MSSGRRDLKNGDKAFIADIARSFHIEKAANKAVKIEKKNNPSTKRAVNETPKKKKNRSVAGGSVWITFKGGFSGVPIIGTDAKQSAQAETLMAARATYRGKLNESALVAAVSHAKDYLSSAKDQAAEAGLHYTGESAAHAQIASKASGADESSDIDYTEGDAYLKEQHAIATKTIDKLLKNPIGSHLASLVGSSGVSKPFLPPAFATKDTKDSFAQAVATQSQLTGTRMEADEARAPMYFTIGQRQDSATEGGTPSAHGNTVCIVRSKASGNAVERREGTKKRRKSQEERGKKSTIIFRSKSKVSAFVQNFMSNVIRKEMSSSMRIRDGADGAPTTQANASPAKQQVSITKQQGKKGRR